MLVDDFNHTIDYWIKELEQYDFVSLCIKPSANSWSIGQVYMHVISQADWFTGQAKLCTSNNDDADKESSPAAKEMLRNNQFPDIIIEGPPSNANTPQPESKEQLQNSLLNLKNEFNKTTLLISTTPYKGKTKHPGLHYFTAEEWLQFADMHFRHHLRQKKRIDSFLTSMKSK